MPFFCLSGNVTAERFFPVLLLPGLTMGNASPEARKAAAPLKRGRSPLAGLPASGGSSAQVRGESCTLGASGPGRLGWACLMRLVWSDSSRHGDFVWFVLAARTG